MNPLEQRLYEYMVGKGVPADIARKATEECARRFISNFILGTATGLGPEAFSANPAVTLLGVARGSFRELETVVGSPSSLQVRDAANKLTYHLRP
jgi:hypothetical protein